MTPVDPEVIKREIAPFLPMREAQIAAFTDSILLRNTDTGACGVASCIYVDWKGISYAVSCHHILAKDLEYITGAKRLTSKIIPENDSHAVAPIELFDSDKDLDLALFTLNGINLPSIPKLAYALDDNHFNSEHVAKHVGAVSFIHAVPGFTLKGHQYEDGLVLLKCPIYAAYGPIIEVSEDLIVGDFAEQEMIEINLKDCPELKDFKANGGTRNLSGMSGSGLWVICEERFVLLGILLGATADNKPESEHRIRFTPIWKVIAWLKSLDLPSAQSVITTITIS
jgi:hypothetical protein